VTSGILNACPDAEVVQVPVSDGGEELLLDIIHFCEIVKDANLVITGEGSADRQTLMGKLPMGIHKTVIPFLLYNFHVLTIPQMLVRNLQFRDDWQTQSRW
jgi:glycerate kinase